LAEARDLKVGTPLEKIISGGQRKRVNVGLELLREPQVLFVDEPTSGLSSRDSENIMDLLKELSLKGKLIFVVIHQPSSDIFKMFDRLLILDVGGYQIYYGNPVEAESYFKDITNLIDKDLGTCPVCGNLRPEEIFNIIETKVVNEYGRLTDKRKVSPQQWEEHFKYRSILPVVSDIKERPEGRLQIPAKLKQFIIFTARDIRSKLSDIQYILINTLEAPLLAAILAFIVKEFPTGESAAYSFGKNVNIPAFFFMSVIVALFMGLTVSAEELIKDRKILKRESFLHLSFLHLSRGSYLFSKITILFGISAIQTFMFALISCLILEIRGMFLAYWLVLFSTASFANVLGLNISSAFKYAVTVYILIPILLIPQLVLGGVVVKFDDLHPSLRSHDEVPLVGDIMTSRWAYEALIVHQFKSNAYEKYYFEVDQAWANADFKFLYYVTTLEAKLASCRKLLGTDDSEELESVLSLLRTEVGKELESIGYDQFPDYEKLTIAELNTQVIDNTQNFLAKLKRYYNNKKNEADSERDAITERIKGQLKDPDNLAVHQSRHQNETIKNMVYNRGIERIVEEDGKLIQKIYPIFLIPESDHFLDLRTQFLVAYKPIFGGYLGTFVFNLLVIWTMSALLIVMLFFDVLGRLMQR
jgi:energy-coupling factor transporter ATP-binding protein EcfA2